MSQVSVQNTHLIFSAELIQKWCGSENPQHLRGVYYPSDHRYLLAMDNDILFISLHKSHRILIKDKNLHGDKSVDIQNLIIDFELDIPESDLRFKIDESLKILTIYF